MSISARRMVSDRDMSRSRLRLLPGDISVFMSSRVFMMPKSGLLSSWAIWEVSRPMAASFSDCSRCCWVSLKVRSISRRSLRSTKIPTEAVSWPLSSRRILADRVPSRFSPSRLIKVMG